MDPKRLPGSFSRAINTTCSNCGGIIGFLIRGATTRSFTCCKATLTGVSPLKGTSPVNNS